MKNYKLLMCTVALTMMLSAEARAISVAQNSDATALANMLIGPGITLVGTPTLTGDAVQFGTFTSGSAEVGITGGVVLSSGNVAQIPGPNTTANPEAIGGGSGGLGYGDNTTSTDISALGSPGLGYGPLDTLAGYPTSDAAVLTFQFQFGDGSTGGNVGIKYVFASEEYLDYVTSVFNDTFIFSVDGNNIALIPGTLDPVSINRINPLQNSSCYINNVDNTEGLPPPPSRQITLDGLTCLLTAQAVGLSAGVHTMTFAIADASDHVLDSAVFLGGGTFSPDTEPESVPEPSSMILLGLGVAGVALFRRQVKHL